MTPRSWTELQVGLEARFPVQFTAAHLDSFAELSGDRNPIHLDTAAAQRLGFSDRVVYGALITAAMSRLLGMEIPGPGCVWHSFSLRFKAPLYVNESAEVLGSIVYANPDLGILRLKFELRRQDVLIAEGEAQAGLRLPR